MRNNPRMPSAPTGRPQSGVQSYLSPRALDRWNPGVRAAASDDSDSTITIYDVIGYDYLTGDGVTANRISAALRSIGPKPVTVYINSPGGDMFEGLAIYNLLREHEEHVTVKVLALAASAASIVAMAGDTVQIARSGFIMVHNSWVVAIGNRHDLREYADTLEPFDRALADIYAARTGAEIGEIQKLMDAETWLGGSDAVDQGFADDLLPADQLERGDSSRAGASAVRRIEAALRSSGLPRSDAMRLLSEFKSSLSDSAGSGGRRPADQGPSDSARFTHLAAKAAELTTILSR